jgi:para-nitrobenzyl esterase
MSTAKSNRVCCDYSAAFASIAVAGFFGLTQTDPFAQFPVNVAYPLSNYPPQSLGFQSAPLALSALRTDFICDCSLRNANLLLSQHVPTYAYEFSDENAPLGFGITRVSFPLGAYHTVEIQYLMNIFGTSATFTTELQQLSDTMIGYWMQFAKTGNPNSAGAPAWSPFSAAPHERQSLVPPAPVAESDSVFDSYHRCSTLWDTL